jgi:hypothetical protein
VDVILKQPYRAPVRRSGRKMLEAADDVADVWKV